MARTRLDKTLRFADHACRDAALLCMRHARSADGEARALLDEASEAAMEGSAAAVAGLTERGVRRRLTRVMTRPMVAVWGLATSLAGTPFTLEMAAHLTRKLELVLNLCAELSADGGPDPARLRSAGARLGEVHSRLAAEAARRRGR